MRKSFSIAILILATFTLTLSEPIGENPEGIKIFKIDLNIEPKFRFQETSLFYKEKVKKVIDSYLALVPDFLLDLVGIIGKAIHWTNPEYYEEVDGMAYNLGIDTDIAMFMQYVYEFTAFCTSAIVR